MRRSREALPVPPLDDQSAAKDCPRELARQRFVDIVRERIASLASHAAGWTWSQNDGKVSGLGSVVRVGFSEKDNGLGVEIGMRVHVCDSFELRAGYEWFDLKLADEGAFNIGGEYFF